MTMIKAIARKELRGYFLSPVALIFIATFLVSCLFSFFWIEGFFARNIADTRPLFTWLPVLLIFLVPALGMRLWSEEERSGTLELLRTYPLSPWALVMGKFSSGLSLVAVCLLLTAPLPLMVDFLGDLDWGPVLGGYLATLLLAGAYLAITLCVSAATPNPIVALVVGCVACGGLYLIGSDPIAHFFGNRGGELLRGLGAGARFESILRGVVDLRDLSYYASLIAFFLTLNVLMLERKRWSEAPERERHRLNVRLTTALLAVNLVAFNVVLHPVRALRVDLTERGEYSTSQVTRRLLGELQEPLLIRGYFSEKTHPLLAPLVPRVRDMIEEYGAIGGDRVTVEILDPTQDPELEKEANQAYGIRSVPFEFASRHQASIVNSYFHVLVRHGDQHETLSWQDLIELDVHGSDVDVRLRNLEYDLTRAIQKVRYGFQSLESVVARLPEPAKLTAIVSRQALPEAFRDAPAAIEKVASRIAERAGERFQWELIDPDAEGASVGREQIMANYGLKPFATSLFADETFYLHMVLETGDRRELLALPESLSEAELEREVVAGLKRAAPGSLKTVGIYKGRTSPLSFQTLQDHLAQTYAVETVTLDEGRVPGHIDVLYVLDPREMKDTELFALDQFLMRGGSALIATSSHAANAQHGRAALRVSEVDSGLSELLGHYGIELGDEVVLDRHNAAFPIPVERNVGGFVLQEIRMLDYPAFVDVRGGQINDDNAAMAGLPNVVLHWPSPVRLEEGGEGEGQVLLRSSPESWTLAEYDAQPDFESHPQLGWPVGTEQRSYPLAVAKVGALSSYYRDREAPLLGQESAQGEQAAGDGALAATDGTGPGGAGTRRGGVIESSPDSTRLAVIGSASLLSDTVVRLGGQFSDTHLANMELAQNLADWSLEDVALLEIRSRGSYARTLAPVSPQLRAGLEWGSYGFAVVAVLAIGAFTLTRRRRAKPIELRPREGGRREPPGAMPRNEGLAS